MGFPELWIRISSHISPSTFFLAKAEILNDLSTFLCDPNLKNNWTLIWWTKMLFLTNRFTLHFWIYIFSLYFASIDVRNKEMLVHYHQVYPSKKKNWLCVKLDIFVLFWFLFVFKFLIINFINKDNMTYWPPWWLILY